MTGLVAVGSRVMEQQAQKIQAPSLPDFDLTTVVEQILHKPGYELWEGQRIESAVAEYKKFCALCKYHPETSIIPGRDVDTLWHRHILNTEKYADDCQSYFGYFLHHRPHSRIKQGTKEANDSWLNTLRLYEEMFQSPPPKGWLDEQSICNGGCDSITAING